MPLLSLSAITGTVSELAIAFQTITNAFRPRWSDHPLIYVFSQKIKEVVRFELTARGALPLTFQAFISAAISVELNQAAAASSRSHHPPPLPHLPYTPKPIPSNPSPRPTPYVRTILAYAPNTRVTVRCIESDL